ncbi:MAG: transcription antitermination factor NusB [Verrucomicrobia bacterium]|nr:transcription antitermination factor NusB [Verrucomicrobiota bacterium]MCH8513549.1 transcription antitermination factor NusB [Kiritimatiellia bacterium]
MSSGAPNRHLLRLWAVQFLFQRDYNQYDTWEEALELFLSDKKKKMSKKMKAFFLERIDGVSLNLDEIDGHITRYSENWDVHRLGGVDRNVLRLGFYELVYCEDVPPVVAVNEAVQLAKELSSDESGKFVNGILDKMIRTLDRPLRQGVPKSEVL